MPLNLGLAMTISGMNAVLGASPSSRSRTHVLQGIKIAPSKDLRKQVRHNRHNSNPRPRDAPRQRLSNKRIEIEGNEPIQDMGTQNITQDFKKDMNYRRNQDVTEETHPKEMGEVGKLHTAPGSVHLQSDNADNESRRTPHDHKNGPQPAIGSTRLEPAPQHNQHAAIPKPPAQKLSDENDIANQAKRKYNNDPRLIYTSAKKEQEAMNSKNS